MQDIQQRAKTIDWMSEPSKLVASRTSEAPNSTTERTQRMRRTRVYSRRVGHHRQEASVINRPDLLTEVWISCHVAAARGHEECSLWKLRLQRRNCFRCVREPNCCLAWQSRFPISAMQHLDLALPGTCVRIWASIMPPKVLVPTL